MKETEKYRKSKMNIKNKSEKFMSVNLCKRANSKENYSH